MSKNILPNTPGGRLRLLRKEQTPKLTLEKLAPLLFYENRSSVSDLEKDKRELSAEQIKALAAFYNVTADYILCLSPVRDPYNQNAADRTGLTENAINTLAEDPGAAKVTSELLDLCSFSALCSMLADLKTKHAEYIKLCERVRDLENALTITPPAVNDFYRVNIARTYASALVNTSAAGLEWIILNTLPESFARIPAADYENIKTGSLLGSLPAARINADYYIPSAPFENVAGIYTDITAPAVFPGMLPAVDLEKAEKENRAAILAVCVAATELYTRRADLKKEIDAIEYQTAKAANKLIDEYIKR